MTAARTECCARAEATMSPCRHAAHPSLSLSLLLSSPDSPRQLVYVHVNHPQLTHHHTRHLRPGTRPGTGTQRRGNANEKNEKKKGQRHAQRKRKSQEREMHQHAPRYRGEVQQLKWYVITHCASRHHSTSYAMHTQIHTTQTQTHTCTHPATLRHRLCAPSRPLVTNAAMPAQPGRGTAPGSMPPVAAAAAAASPTPAVVLARLQFPSGLPRSRISSCRSVCRTSCGVVGAPTRSPRQQRLPCLLISPRQCLVLRAMP